MKPPPEIAAQRVDDDGDFVVADGRDDSVVVVYKGAKDKHIPTGGGRRGGKMNGRKGMEKGWGAF